MAFLFTHTHISWYEPKQVQKYICDIEGSTVTRGLSCSAAVALGFMALDWVAMWGCGRTTSVFHAMMVGGAAGAYYLLLHRRVRLFLGIPFSCPHISIKEDCIQRYRGRYPKVWKYKRIARYEVRSVEVDGHEFPLLYLTLNSGKIQCLGIDPSIPLDRVETILSVRITDMTSSNRSARHGPIP